ncbi:MAG: HEAT repeat domain-containing protein [Chloroflexota bacterium]|nr:MAG: hypothetical protein DIU68_14060 [Chloroflexota bacterium]
MLDLYVEQLRSADPQVRRQAIIALGKQKDPAALRPLAEVYRNDPDPALRELAYKAGRYIKANAAPETTPAAPPETSLESLLSPLEETGSRDEAPAKPVSKRNIERAKSYFDRALDFHVRQDAVKAVEMMAKALDANPYLAQDSVFLNMAIDLTGQGARGAVATLSDPEARDALLDRLSGGDGGSGRARRKRKTQDQDWGPALLDLGIYGLVNGAIAFVTTLVALQALVEFILAGMAAGGGNVVPGIMGLEGLTTANISLPLAGLYGILYALISAIMLLLTDGAVHLVATTVMGGEGTLVGLIRRTTLYFTVLVPISTVISLLPAFLNDGDTFNPAFSLVSLAFTIGTLVWAGKLTGDAYDFGTARGCLSIFLGGLALALLFACGVFTLSLVLAQAFGAAQM